MDGVGVGDVDVHVRARTARVALRPLEEVQRDGASMYEPVSRATLVRLDVKAEALVSVKGGVQVKDGDDRGDALEPHVIGHRGCELLQLPHVALEVADEAPLDERTDAFGLG